MRLGMLAAACLLTVSACSTEPTVEKADPPARSSTPSPTAQQPEAPEPPMDDVALWSLCADHAKGEVMSDDWSFPYSDDVEVTGKGTTWTVTGPANGPMDQTFKLSCTYTDVTADGARLKSYSLV